MVRFALSLVAASVIAFSGYSALGAATTQGSSLKVIAVVVAHARPHSAVSSAQRQAQSAVVQ